MMSDQENQSEQFAELVKEMITADPPEAVQSKMDEMLQNFRGELTGHPYVRKLERRRKDESSIAVPAARRLAPLPVAAGVLAVFLIVLGSVSLLRQSMAPVAWAEVADRVAGIDRFMFDMRIRVPRQEKGEPPPKRGPEQAMTEAAMTFYISSDYGFRWDVSSDDRLMMSWFTSPGGDSTVVVNHEEETWLRLPSYPNQREQSPLSPEEDPDEYIRRFLAHGYRELGESIIDGVEVEGIEVADPPAGGDSYMEGVGRLWVDVSSELPLRLELKGESEGRYVEWILDFRWGEQVDIEEFTPVIPPGFTPPE